MNLEYTRKIYLTYEDRISQTLFEEQPFIVSWTH